MSTGQHFTASFPILFNSLCFFSYCVFFLSGEKNELLYNKKQLPMEREAIGPWSKSCFFKSLMLGRFDLKLKWQSHSNFTCECFACIYVCAPHACILLKGARRGRWISWNWRYRGEWTTLWGLGTERGFSIKATGLTTKQSLGPIYKFLMEYNLKKKNFLPNINKQTSSNEKQPLQSVS